MGELVWKSIAMHNFDIQVAKSMHFFASIMDYAGMVRSHARRSFVNRNHALRQEHRNTNIYKIAQIPSHCNKNEPRQLQGKFRIMKWRMEVGSGPALQKSRDLEDKIPKSVVR